MLGAAFISAVLPMSSLFGGFMGSTLMAKGVVLAQAAGLLVAAAVAVRKSREFRATVRASRLFLREFLTGRDVLDYYLLRNTGKLTSLELIYDRTCERMVKLLNPDMRRSVIGRQIEGQNAALSAREIELVRSTCAHTVQEEKLRVEHGLGLLVTVVAAAPALGLLGTVWCLLDKFADLAAAETVSLAAASSALSSALTPTVVGLLVAIPCAVLCYHLKIQVRRLSTEMDGFADELLGRIACEFQGRTG